MIDLYTWATPNGRKISIMLEECGLAYNVHPINISKNEQFTPDFLKISPNNKIPALVDSEGPGGGKFSVFESGAILFYLAEKTGKFLPTDPVGRSVTLQWLMFQMGGLGPMAGQANHFNMYAPQFNPVEQLTYGQQRYSNEVNRLFGVLNKRLADREFIAGAFSIADMASWPWVVGFKNFGQKLDDFPNLQRWFEKAVGLELRAQPGINTDEQRKILFGQTAQVVR